jgi:hypothetical protein
MSTDAPSARVDLPTVIAISALAYTLANIVHEGLGHGGTCILVGARPTVLNTIFFEYDDQAATLVQQKWISAGGSIANVLVALPILRVLRRERLPASSRYFLWLFAAVNLLTAFGYLLYSGIGGVGDWSRVVHRSATRDRTKLVLDRGGRRRIDVLRCRAGPGCSPRLAHAPEGPADIPVTHREPTPFNHAPRTPLPSQAGALESRSGLPGKRRRQTEPSARRS